MALEDFESRGGVEDISVSLFEAEAMNNSALSPIATEIADILCLEQDKRKTDYHVIHAVAGRRDLKGKSLERLQQVQAIVLDKEKMRSLVKPSQVPEHGMIETIDTAKLVLDIWIRVLQ